MDSRLLQSKPPLIIDALSCTPFRVNVALLKILDCTTGKEFLHLDTIFQAAKKSALEDVYVCVSDSNVGATIEAYVKYLYERKKRRVGKMRIEVLKLSKDLSQADVIRHLDQVWGPHLAKGFFWIDANIVPPDDFELLYETHKTAAKKDSATIATLYPTQVSALSCMSIPNERYLVVADGKSNELLSCLPFDGYVQNHLDFKSLIPLEGRWEIPPESLTVRSDLQLPHLFFGTSELLRVYRENFDYKTFEDAIFNALRGEVKMEAIYLVTKHLKTFSKSQMASAMVPLGAVINHGRQLYEYLRNDALKDNDKINDQGSRSSWKFDSETRKVWFENVEIGKDALVTESLLMEDVTVAPSAKITNSIIGKGVAIGENVDLSHVIICEGVKEITAGAHLQTVVVTADTDGEWSEYSEELPSPLQNYHVWRPLNASVFKWNETPNTIWKSFSKALDNDPSRDPDRMYDELYGENEGDNSGSKDSSQSDPDEVMNEDFIKEARQMLRSVVGRPDHVKNIILELRTYRLSANKPDSLVLEAVAPVIIDWMRENIDLRKRNSQSFEESALGEVLESFSSSDDPHTQYILLDACWQGLINQGLEDFVSCLYILQPYMLQEEALMKWVEADSERKDVLLPNHTFQCYVKWLFAEDNSDN